MHPANPSSTYIYDEGCIATAEHFMATRCVSSDSERASGKMPVLAMGMRPYFIRPPLVRS